MAASIVFPPQFRGPQWSPPPISELETGYKVPVALGVIVELGVPDRLASGPQHVADLARTLKADEDALLRILRHLAMAGVFMEVAPRTFALTPLADSLRTGEPGSVRDVARFGSIRMLGAQSGPRSSPQVTSDVPRATTIPSSLPVNVLAG
jgi:hypothetical protein